MKKYNLVYKITNLLNKKIYIGVHCTNNIDDNYMGSGKHIKNSIKKHGIENFKKEILFNCEHKLHAYMIEKEIVTIEFVNRVDTYNLREGGEIFKNSCHFKWTDEQKYNLKINRPTDGKNNPMFGKGYKLQGINNGRHRENFNGDIKEVGKNISNTLKKTNKNKKENNSAAKKYFVFYEPLNIYMDIDKGYLINFCKVFNIKYTSLYNTLKTQKPIRKG